jgi:hypothetical protein
MAKKWEGFGAHFKALVGLMLTLYSGGTAARSAEMGEIPAPPKRRTPEAQYLNILFWRFL